MPSPSMFKLGAFLVAVIACATVVEAWRADRRDRAQLAAELAATKQLLTAADARQLTGTRSWPKLSWHSTPKNAPS